MLWLMRTIFGVARNDESLTRVELARLEGSVTALKDVITAMQAGYNDHENRIRKGEYWRYAMPPALLLSATSLIVAILHH